MPVRKVGPNSYQWGTSGKVYTGKDAKAKAERQGRAIYASGYREAESYKPPASAVSNAKRGLALRKEYGRGGLSPSEAKSQGIDSGVTRARKIASGKVSRHDVRRMSAFNRHRKNYRPEKKMPDGGPTAGTIAWLLWGGTSGVNWAKKKSASMNAESEEHQDEWHIVEVCDEGAICQDCTKDLEGERGFDWVIDDRYGGMGHLRCSDCHEEFDAEDYNSFTEEIQSLIDKYGVLQHYETSYYDNLMEVSFSFQPHDPYFDQVDFDAEKIGSRSKRKHYLTVADLKKALKKAKDTDRIAAGDIYDEDTIYTPMKRIYRDRIDNNDYLIIVSDDGAGGLYWDKDTEDLWNAEDWSGDPEGPLAKALARAREKLSQPRKPLRITSLPHPDQKTLKDFESDNWKLLPRDRMGRWRKPVDSESINRLTESLSSDVPSISELLTMYGGDTPTNRFRLYQDLQTLSIAQMDAALPDDSIVEFDEADLSWMTPEEYYQYVLEEPLNISDDIEDDTQTVEFQDRLVRYTAMTMTPTEVDDLLERNLKDVVADLFAPDSEDTEAEIAFLLAVKRYQEFSDRYSAE